MIRALVLAGLEAGRSYYRPLGVEHNVINANAGTVTHGTNMGHNVCNGGTCP